MEVLSAVSLVSNIVQFIDFFLKATAYKDIKEVDAHISGFFDEVVELAARLRDAIEKGETFESAIEHLSQLALDCTSLADEWVKFQRKYESSGSIEHHFRRLRMKSELEKFRSQAKKLRDRIQVVLLDQVLKQQTTLEHSFRILQDVELEQKAQQLADKVTNLQQAKSADTSTSQSFLDTLVEQLNLDCEIKDIVKTKDYEAVTVLPLMWAEPLVPYPEPELSEHKAELKQIKHRKELAEIEQELVDIGSVFRTRFGYSVKEIFKIPDDQEEAESLLQNEIHELVKQHGKKGSLLIVIYGGHGADTRSVKNRGDDNSIWAASTSAYGAQVNWAAIQTNLEIAKADCLLILDCCFSGTAMTRGKTRTINEILAACVREHPSYSGARNYTKLLTRRLERISLPCRVSQLHDMMHSASIAKTSNEDGQIHQGLYATPDHGWAGNSQRQSIRLHKLTSEPSDISMADASSSRALIAETSIRESMFIEVVLEPSKDVDTAISDWRQFLRASPLPGGVKDIIFHNKASLHTKTTQEKEEVL
ncbi:hypothetical protein ACET3X_000018 [Alternaria dauci]|uniref:Peptidase C14 caspase domain-containing protein n=1 Tax=Alternaria dauci TaxID=48095 RepID=A0ABR3UT90_9PLEO